MGKMCCLVHDEKVLIHDISHIKCMLHTENYSCEILRNFAIGSHIKYFCNYLIFTYKGTKYL